MNREDRDGAAATVAMIGAARRHGPTSGRLLKALLRAGITALVLGILFSQVDLSLLRTSLQQVAPSALAGCLGAMAGAVAVAIVRWRILLAAYGAVARPSYLELTRWYFIAMFYNLLPGAVGGDVLRACATRHYFADGTVTRSMGVVFLERLFGLIGVLTLTSFAATLNPNGPPKVLGYALLGLVCAGAVFGAISAGARMLPGRPGALLRRLPAIAAPAWFALAVLISPLTHMFVALSGHLVLTSLDADVSWLDSLTAFSIGTMAAYFPMTIAGAGTRDAAVVALLAHVGVNKADALASSLSVLMASVALAAIGALLRTSSAGNHPIGGDFDGASTPV